MSIEKQLGGGFDGIVLGTSRKTAIKSMNNQTLYQQEITVYLRLLERGITNVNGFQVPQLIDHDDSLAVLEMTIVSPPFVLDFAGARLDRRHQFPEDIIEEWRAEKREQFEADWPKVQRLMWAFESLGIHLNDVHPGNVACH